MLQGSRVSFFVPFPKAQSPEGDANHKLLAPFQIPLNPSINWKTVNLTANNLHPATFFMVK